MSVDGVQVIIYSKDDCPYCDKAKLLLSKKGVSFIHEIRVDLDPNSAIHISRYVNKRTVPQIFIGNKYVGGYSDLEELNKQGLLNELLGL